MRGWEERSLGHFYDTFLSISYSVIVSQLKKSLAVPLGTNGCKYLLNLIYEFIYFNIKVNIKLSLQYCVVSHYNQLTQFYSMQYITNLVVYIFLHIVVSMQYILIKIMKLAPFTVNVLHFSYFLISAVQAAA